MDGVTCLCGTALTDDPVLNVAICPNCLRSLVIEPPATEGDAPTVRYALGADTTRLAESDLTKLRALRARYRRAQAA